MGGTRNMNHEEEKAVEELKVRIKDDLTPAMKEDATIYYRFLKARDFDIAKAEKMLRKDLISDMKKYERVWNIDPPGPVTPFLGATGAMRKERLIKISPEVMAGVVCHVNKLSNPPAVSYLAAAQNAFHVSRTSFVNALPKEYGEKKKYFPRNVLCTQPCIKYPIKGKHWCLIMKKFLIYDVNKGSNITWRKIYQADTIVQNFQPKEVFEKMMEPSLIGYDKDGDMVLYHPAGSFNIFDVYKSIKVNDLIKHLTWFGERRVATMEEHNKKTGNCRYQATVIIDADKLTLRDTVSKLTLDLFIRFVHMYQDNYPERMKYIYVINVPSYFIYIFSVLKSALASTTVKKIHIYNHDGWKVHLLEFIDADVLPAFLGGTRTDPDGNPRCRSFISPGGRIPEKYFLTDNDRYFDSSTQVTKMTLSNQEKKEVTVNIAEAGLLLQWEFLVRNKDIGFGVFFQDFEGKIQEIIPVQKYDTSDGIEKDFYKCHSSGTYIIIFDNSYSWMSSKTLAYSINVRKPNV